MDHGTVLGEKARLDRTRLDRTWAVPRYLRAPVKTPVCMVRQQPSTSQQIALDIAQNTKQCTY